jgi:hypothetical protein
MTQCPVGFLRTIEVLLDHGADPDARDSHGRTTARL